MRAAAFGSGLPRAVGARQDRPSAQVEAVAFDLDGVVWRGFDPIPHVREVIGQIRAAGLRVCFLSNYANRERSHLCRRLADIGIPAEVPDVFTSSFLAARHLHATRAGEHQYVTIEDGDTLARELRSFGMSAQALSSYTPRAPESPCSVVVGYTEDFGYQDAAMLLRVSEHVDGLYATARDRWYAAQTGRLPASGWIVAAAEEILAQRAVTLGKPNALALRTVADALGVPVARILMVGDSAESDVGAARNAGAVSCLFREPGATGDRPSVSEPRADHVVTDLREVLRLLRPARDPACAPPLGRGRG
ncbi:HAD-IIA family hydrolase [Streptomyces sp. NPDC049040]|uniref:HAD-IIA family hydrolase n=1 Tax=Streptomyces sp. NPDC049040 TaxID=3365593 RepID=UPI003717A7C6